MAEQQPPPPEPADLLERLLLVISQGRSRWWWWLIGGAIVAVTVIVARRALAGSGEELARLRHAQTETEEEHCRAKIDAQVLQQTSQAEAARARADKLQLDVDAIDTTIQAARRKHAENLAAINRLRSWSDIRPRAR